MVEALTLRQKQAPRLSPAGVALARDWVPTLVLTIPWSERTYRIKKNETGMPIDARPHVQEALFRIQIEYVEMPQLKLTARQVQRPWSLPRPKKWTSNGCFESPW